MRFLKKRLSGNIYLFGDGARPQFKITFIIDATGAYREVRPLHIRRAWAAPLAKWIWDFVEVESEILPGVHLTDGELLKKIKDVCDTNETHFPDARRFVRFLNKMPQDKIFDEEAFWNLWRKYYKSRERFVFE